MTMRFRVVHKTCTYLLLCTSMTALLMPGQVDIPTIIALAVGVLISWFWEPPRVNRERFVFLWNFLTLAVLAKVVFNIVTGAGAILGAIDFVLFLGVNKVFNRQTNSDYQQISVISLLQMIAAAVLSTDPSFGLLFGIYIILTTWVLILFHLKREIEDNLLLKYGESLEPVPVRVERILNSRRLIGPRFLATTSGISLIIFLGAATFFFLFPRIGFRLFHQNRAGLTMAGFNDRIELGNFGLIKDNPTIVMRVEFENPDDRHDIQPYWRGMSFDRYDGKRWSKSKPRTRRNLPRKGKRIFLKSPSETSPKLIKQNIYLDPMEQQVLFGLDEVVGLQLPRISMGPIPTRYRAIQRDLYGDLYYEQQDDIAFNYEILSQVSPLPNEIESTTKADVRKYERGIRRQTHYTQVPIDTSPAIRALAKTLIGSENNVLKAVAKVEQYLKANYDYTLDLKRNEHLQPLDDFLFEQKRGHCEYFATAMAILLRAEGIGTRIVNGFLGGQWNRYGQYFAVAQGDAHSWLEVQLPMEHCEGERCTWSTHWVRRDPTPAGTGSPTEISLLSRLRAYTDAFRMRWYKHVIEYDLEQQAGLISTAQKAWKHLATPNTRLSPAELATRRKATWIVGGCLLALIICGIAYRRRRHQSHRQKRTKVSKTALIAVHLMDECLRLYERHGYIRQDHQTPREFLSDLTRQAAPGCPTVACIVDLYETLRFGLEDDQKTEIPSLLKALRQIEFPPVVNA